MVATRKTNQVDIDLNSIKDESTRFALSQILILVNELVGLGLDTDGTVKARNGIAAGFANDASPILWLVRKNSLAADTGSDDHYDRVIVPGRVLGVSGWAQFNGSKQWRLLGTAIATTSVFVSNAAAGAPQNYETEVVFQNSDVTHKNAYRAVIFYEPTIIDRETKANA